MSTRAKSENYAWIPKEIETFFRECELAGLVVHRDERTHDVLGDSYGMVTKYDHPDADWVELSVTMKGYRLFGAWAAGYYETIEDLLEAANKEINSW